MRTEVKRSLLLWPAAASAAITAVSWIGTQFPTWMPTETVAARHVSALTHVAVTSIESLEAPFVANCVISLSPARYTPVAERSECGIRSVRLPERVAEVFGQGERLALMAPSRSEQHELAGLALQLASAANSRTSFDEGVCVVSEYPLSTETLQSIRNRSRVIATTLTSESDSSQSEFVIDADTIAMISPSQSALNESVNRKSSLPESNRVLAKPSRTQTPVAETLSVRSGSESYITDLPQIQLSPSSGSVERRSATTWPAGWPVTTKLDSQLQSLATSTNVDSIASWSDQVVALLGELHSLPRLGDASVGSILDQLERLTREGERAAEAMADRDAQSEWLRVVHALDRRVKVWMPVWKITRDTRTTYMVTDDANEIASSNLSNSGVNNRAVVAAVNAVRSELFETGDEAGWTTYLLLDEIESAASSKYGDDATPENRSIVAQRLLSRLSWHVLQEVHLRWLDRASVRQLSDAVRPWARGAVDYADLMSQIERQESDALDLAAIEIADAVQTLRFADNSDAVQIADSVGAYYRNANVRLAVSQDMLNRMLPSIDPKTVPVRTTMMGTKIRGTSQISSDLAISLTPSPDQWSLQLKTLGNVNTQSTGFNGPVALRTTGNSNFVAAAPIIINRNGINASGVSVDVQGRTQLRGIRSDYDQWPLVGSLVRSIAESRFEQAAPTSNRIANRKIETEVASEIETRLNEQIGRASNQLSTIVLGPLSQLQLDPQVIDMQTTESRLIARYRLAGDWQLGAFTPRPRAPHASMMSLQVHQSAINNTLEQLVPRDEPMAIDQVVARAANLFGQEVSMPDDMPEGVTIQFARTRPITVEIEDGQFWVTMRIVRLSQGDRLNLTQFIVRACYVPQVNGLEASLVRDGHLRISGPDMSMRERLPVRAIFNKVLSVNRPIPLTLPALIEHPSMQGLAISQLEMRSGWIGIALSEENAPRVAWKK